jgi:hypothetical protein
MHPLAYVVTPTQPSRRRADHGLRARHHEELPVLHADREPAGRRARFAPTPWPKPEPGIRGWSADPIRD